MVTGPIPRNPNATSPNAKMAVDRSIMMVARPAVRPAGGGDAIGDGHESADGHAGDPERREVAGCETAQNVERGAAFLAGGHDLANVSGCGPK